CQVALTSDVFKGHRKAQHAHTITGKDSEDLQAFLHCHHVYARPEDVSLPSPGGPIVQGLCPPQPGFTCQIAGCTYAAKSEDVIKKHKRTKHAPGHLHQGRYCPCNIQALFNSVEKAFFQVSDALLNKKDPILLQLALLDVGTSFNADGTAAVTTDKDRTPPALLRVTSWAD
ncbi:hypothetical protein V8E55_007439, partial [Tylopilus felleus]